MTDEQREAIESDLRWLGIDASAEDCDICEDGSVWYGLVQVCGKHTINQTGELND